MMKMNSLKNLRKIKFEDLIIKDLDDYTIINKPPFLSSLEDRNDPINILGLARSENAQYQICHRIDKETSGIIVLAKNPEAYKHFALQLENRQVKKVYHAVIKGKHQFENFEADEPLYTTSNRSRVDFKLGKPSLTLLSTLQLFKKHTLIKCFPVTGRMHQIRAHLAFHEAPIVSDLLYGGKNSYLSEIKRNYKFDNSGEETPMINRVALHAQAIAFKNLKESIVEINADYPKDFNVLLKQLNKYN